MKFRRQVENKCDIHSLDALLGRPLLAPLTGMRLFGFRENDPAISTTDSVIF